MKSVIRLEKVSFWRGETMILDEVSWQVNQGERWLLFGLNGSGKTTLLKLINGYLYPSKGKVEVLDYVFGQSPLFELRKKIGWISTALNEVIPPDETLLEVVVSGLYASIGLWEEMTEEIEKKALSVLSFLGMLGLKDRKYSHLSQGERQKAMIGRALICSPKLLIFDEVYNGLDLFAKKLVEDLIEKLAQNPDYTLIFVTHETRDISPKFSKTLLLREGKIFKQGVSQEVMTRENLMAFYHERVNVTWYEGRLHLSLKH